MSKKVKMAVLLFFAILLCFILSIPIVNNITAFDVAKGLKALPLPENTELTEYYLDVTDGAEYLSVAPQAGQIVEGIEHDTLSFQTHVNSSDYYIVSNWGNGFRSIYSELDVRGH